MYRTWVMILSIGLILPLRWLPQFMPRSVKMTATVLPVMAMISCGELQLNNPTVSPAGPYCPGQNIQISFTGVNLPEGEDIQIFLDDISTYNPFTGGGDYIGAVPIEYSCTDCPALLGLLINACATEQENEFMLMHSGCGFNVSDLYIDLLPIGSSGNDFGSGTGCPLMAPSGSVMAGLQSSTGCSSVTVIPAGPGDQIPAGALVFVFMTNTGPTVTYDISYLCALGLPIYVVQNSCSLGTGAFANTCSTPRTYSISAGSCTSTVQYGTPDCSWLPNPGATGHVFMHADGTTFSWHNTNCNQPAFNLLSFPDVAPDVAIFTYTIPNLTCPSGSSLQNFYVSGMIDMPAPCEDILYTPPSALSLAVSCPIVIDPAGPFCSGSPPVQLTANPPGGTWTVTPYLTSTGIFTPSLAMIGLNNVTYMVAPCGSSSITILVNDGPSLNPSNYFPTQTSCAGDSSGEIVNADYPNGGTWPYTFDWDDVSTPGNDVYPDDGNDVNPHGLTGVPAGFYYFIVTDALGCRDTVTIEVQDGPAVTATLQIDSINCFGGTGNLGVATTTGPPTLPTFDWDDASTPFNDDFGGPPDPTIDDQYLFGLPAGTYYLTITYEDPGFWICQYFDTITLTEPPQLIVTVANDTINCFGQNNGTLTANTTGGEAPYQFNWSHIPGPGPEPQTVTGLTPNTYIVTVTDASGCTATATATVTQPPLLTASATGETIDCDDNTGDINLTVMGGTTPYMFLWSNMATTEDLSGLNSGTYTVTVTDANGCTTTASATISLNPPTFMLPPDDGVTVPCLIDAQVPPTPPAVNNSCDDPLTMTGPTVSSDPACSGIKTYTYTYTDPATGIMDDWVFTYTILPPTFSVPAPGALTVDCVASTPAPTPPMVTDNCNNTITPSAGVPSADPPCGGTKTWTFTYTGCDGTTEDWVFTYTINTPTVTLPPPGASIVNCPANATLPTPPAVTDNCGIAITPSAGVPSADPPCGGTKTWTFTYTACDGTPYDWVYTYTINAPTISLPPPGSSTVACPSDAVEPTPPMVTDNCGNTISPSAGVPGADPPCAGPKTWTFTYTGCDGMTFDWVYTYTISAPTVTMPPGGSSTVDCPADAVAPMPPAVMDNCGRTITPSAGVPGADPPCAGPKTWTFTYTACDGTPYTWVYTYTISAPTVSLPAPGSSTVDCPSDAIAPMPPAVTDNCGRTITPSAGVPGADPPCGGPKTWTFTYTACDGTPYDWIYTYTINIPTITLPAPESSTVDCVADATAPTPPPVTDNCGNTITPSAGVPSADPPCGGTKTWTFTYTGCDGMTQDWVYTYTINTPTVTLPAPGSSTVDCPADATLPVPPVVTDNCGNTVSPSAGVPSADPTCGGTKTWTFTYTGCDGTPYDWVYTYTINPPTIPIPPAGSSTVDCPSAATAPVPPVVSDNCGTDIPPSMGVPSADPLCAGIKTWTFTYTACDGSTFDWIYTYTINPPTVMLPPGGSSTVDCPSDATAPTPPAVTDNCGRTITPSAGVPGADPPCAGPKTWTFTYTACDGTPYDWVYTYTINPPTVTLPPAGSSTVDCPSDATLPAPPAVTDNCGRTITPSAGVPSADPPCGGPKTWTFTYTACDGTPYDWVYTYTINPPTISLPPAESSTVDCVADAIAPTPPVVTDNCGDPVTPSAGVPSADPMCGGIKTWTFTFTGCDGTPYDWVYTYTINPPTVSLPAPGASIVDCPSDATAPTPPVVTDNCGNAITPSAGVPSADPLCGSTKTWTFTYTACDGTPYDWVFTYTINPPTISLPPGGSSTVDCPADAIAPTPPTVTDNCGNTITPSAGVPGADPPCAGDKTWTFTYTSCDGTPFDWVYTYTINPPTVMLPPGGSSTVDCAADAIAPSPPTVMDNCGRSLTPSAGVPSVDPSCAGDKTWTFTYTACDGNTFDWIYTYTVNAPTITLPPPGSSTVDCPGDAVAPIPTPLTDNCGNTVTPSAGVPSADPTCDGTKTWTFTYTACDGTTYDWIYTYTINAPFISLPPAGSSTVDCVADAVAPTPPSVTDNCGNTITPSAGVPSADPPCGGVKTWTFTYAGCDGSTSDWIYTYTINAPTISLPPAGSSTVDCVADAIAPTPPAVTDNCGNTITPSAGVPSADPPCGGTKTWTFTYTGCDGTPYDWVYTYTINAPTISLPPPGSSTVDCVADAIAPTPPTVTDNCGNTITPSAGVPSADPVCGGNKTWTFTYTGCDGTTQDWVYTYTVNPTSITLPPAESSTVDCPADAVEPTPPMVLDNCGDPVTPSAGVPSVDPPCAGDKTWTFTYTACDGTPFDWVYTYTINSPTVMLPPGSSSTVDCAADATAPVPPTVMDNCGRSITPSAGVPSVDPSCAGDKTWTFTYTACDGNTYDWVYTYTVNAPSITLPPPGSSTVDCPSDAIEPTPPPVTDNCGNNVVPSAGVPSADPTCDGTKTWTFTYTTCDGSTYDWIYTYTINAPSISLPPGGSSVVDCVADAIAPTPPSVVDNCGNTITPSAGVPSADPPCGGVKTWTFTYAGCDGSTSDWVYTYTINPPTITLPPAGSSTVDCVADAVAPTPPAVTDNCGNTISPSAGVPGADPVCGGDKTWTFAYTACDGAIYDWVYTYTVNPPTISLPPAGSSSVDCPADAVEPTPPAVTDNCGDPVTPSAGVPSADPPCAGDKTWTFTYTACDGSTFDWIYTYTINPPTVNLPAGGSSTVDCVADALEPTPPTVTDNCNRPITPSAGVPSVDPSCAGDKTWTFTYIACDGSTYDWVYTYTINAPTVSLPPPGMAIVDCVADAIAPAPPVVTDNCGNTLTPSAGVPSADPPCGGIKTWTFAYTNCDGSTSDWVFTYTINPPTFSLPPGGSSTVDCVADAIAPTPPSVIDNCGNTITPSAGVPSADPPCGGTKTWTFTYTGCDGTTSDWVYTYTVNVPTITLPAPGNSTVDCVADAVAPVPPVVTDNCGNTIPPSAGVPGADPVCGGDKTWTFTYTGCDGATYDWVYTYTINAPTISLPAPGSSTVDCPSEAVEPVPPVVTDNCGDPVTPSPAAEGADPACAGDKTWTFTYTACDGTTFDWVYTYTINPPTVSLPPGGSSTVDCIADAIEPTPPVVMDNCNRPITPSAGVPSIDPSCAGDKTWTFTYTACDGATYDWVYTYTVNAPTITLPPPGSSTVDCPADAIEPTPPPVTDNCGNSVVPAPGSPSADPTCDGIKTWTFIYTTCDGQTYDWIYTYTINAPGITLPPPGAATVDCVADAIAPAPPVVIDNCGNTLPPSAGVPSADPPCGGTKTWTYTYTTCDGSTSDWVFTYTINPPTFSLPPAGSATVDCVADAVAPTPPFVSDNCGNTITPSAGVPSADPPCGGTKTWTFTYTGCDGTTSDWVYTYTVNVPTITLPAPGNSTVDCVADAVAPVPPVVTDNCGNTIPPSAGVPSADPVCGGDKTWTFTYTGCDGATYDWVYTYTINAPTINLPAPESSTVDCPADAVEPVPPVVTDNCGDPVTPSPAVEGADPACAGDKTWTFTYTACDGTTFDWVYTYTINPPTVSLPPGGSSTVDCIADAIEPTPPVVMDNCNRPITPSAGVPSIDPSCAGDKTWTFTYTACDGATYDWVYTYTVNAPTITLPAPGASTVDCVVDAIEPTPPSVTDNCGNIVTPSAGVPGADPICEGTKTWTFTYTACDGQTYDWIYTYTINAPTVTFPPLGAATVDCVADAIAPTPPVVTDNCGETLTPSAGVPSADPPCGGIKTWTFTYTTCDGSTSDWVFTYTINPPTFSLPPGGSSTVDCVADAIAPTPPSVTDNCGNTITPSAGVPSADPPCGGTKTWTFTYTGCDGTTSDWVYTYTVNVPTITLPAPGNSTVDCVADAVAPVPPVVTDNCGNTIPPSAGVPSADPVCGGDKTWTFTYTGCDGATYDWVYTYTINAPTINLPAPESSTVDCPADAVEPVPPVVTDNCGDPVTPSPAVEGADPACAGDKTWTFTYTACDGTTFDWVYTYTINPPTVSLPPGGSSTVDCIADAIEPTPPVVMDNCNRPITPSAGVPSIDPSCAGDKTWTFTYTACDGATYDWVYTYTVNAPTITLPAPGASTVDCIGDAVAPTPPPVVDNCGNMVTASAGVPGPDPICDGDKTWTFTYTTCDGQTYDWIYTYTINAPTVTFPPPGSGNVDCVAEAIAPTPPVVTDNCGDPLSPSAGVPGTDPPCGGTKTWTFTYTTCDGGTHDWIFTYTINIPTFSVPPGGSSTVDCVADAVAPAPPVVTDNCGNTITPTPGVPGADPNCGGTKTWTFTYIGCDATAFDWVYTYTISVPTIMVPAPGSSTVACVGDAVAPVPPVVTDNCGTTVSPSAGVPSADPVCDGIKTWTFTYTACDGTPFDWVYTYTITAPTINLPPDDGTTVACIGDAQVEPVPPTVMNSCGDPVIPTGPAVSADPICDGIKTYTWTYTDCAGGTTDWVYTYTINAPTINLPPNDGSTVDCASDAQVEPVPPVVNDSCGDPVIPTGPSVSTDPVCAGIKTYTWTYLDCSGGSVDWTYTYTVLGDTGPVFDNPPADMIVSCVQDLPPMISLSYTNTCSPGGSVIGTDSSIGGTCPAIMTRTWTVTDACGNEATVIQTFTINDTTLPTASDPAPIDLALCNAPIPAPDIAVVTDAADDCGTVVVAFLNDATNLVGCTETTTRTYSVTDACNNSIVVTQIITRTVDMTPPVFTNPPSDLMVDCIVQVPPMTDLDYTDNCSMSGTVAGTETGPSGDPLTIIRTWTITDDCGNVATVSQTIIILESSNTTTLTESFCTGDSYILPDGSTTMVGGMYGPYSFTGSNGCDSMVVVDLTELSPVTTDLIDQFCEGGIYVLPDGSTTSMGGSYGPFMFTGQNGCDSIVNLELTEISQVITDLVDTFCEGDTYVLPDGSTTLVGGSFGPYMFTSGSGCDSLVNVDLTRFDADLVQITDAICSGEDYVLPDGTTTNMGGMFGPFDFVNADGCDSTVWVNLTENNNSITNLTDSFCNGDIYMLPDGSTTMTGGIFGPYTFPAANGCDSIVTLNLTGFDPVQNNIVDNFCEGQTYILPDGSTTTVGGMFGPYLFITNEGCDSTVFVNLTLINTIVTNLDDSFCEGSTYILPDGSTTTVGGSFGPYPFPTGSGCDSLVFVELEEILQIINNLTDEFCTGDVYVLPDGSTTTTGGAFGPYMYTSQGGCDSIVNLQLNEIGPPNVSITDPGPRCTSSGVFTLQGTPAGGVWSGDVTNDQFNPATMGTGVFEVIYTVTQGGCSDADTIMVTVYELTISCLTIQNETAPGANDGQGQVSVSGGVGPYTISWTGPTSGSIGLNSDGSFIITGLPGGVYNIEVEDAEGCVAVCSFTIEGALPCDLTIDNIIADPATCSGINNGVITVSANSTMPPIEYSINGIDFQLSNVFTMLAPGGYTITVRDAAGCTATQNIVVDVGQGPELMIVSVEDASCGVDNGSVTATSTGGAPPVMYSIDGTNYGVTPIFPGLGAGNYLVYLIDAAGCTDTLPVTVNSTNAPMITNISIVNASCGQSDGSITITATGGAAPLMYSINGGLSFQSSNVFNNLPAGTYNIVVQDATGCPVNGTATIQDLGGPTISSIIPTPTSCGANDGTITINATGINPLTYSIGGAFQSSNVFLNVAAGTYTVTVRDGNGCVTTQIVTVNTTDGPQITNIQVTHTTCGEDDGSITITATGGTGTLTYLLNGTSYGSNNMITGLPAGLYNIEVVDINGCSATGQVTINPSEGAEFRVIITPAHCGQSDGILDVDALEGQPPFTYSINNGPFTPVFIFPNRPEGDYIIRMRDANGCEFELNVYLWEELPPMITGIITTDPDCGQTNGRIEVSGTGFQLMYSRQLPTFQMSNVFDPVPPGTYTITIRDFFGCTDSEQVTINPKPNPNISTTQVNSDCGLSNGSITINGSGGLGPYTYALNTGMFGPNNVFTNLPAGTYTAHIRDANGCENEVEVVITSIGAQSGAFQDEFCIGDTYTFHGETYTSGGVYSITLVGGASNGCDSVITLTLSGLPLVPFTFQEFICEGEVYIYNGTPYSMPGTYLVDTLQAVTGCDTALSLQLIVNPLLVTYLDTVICTGGVVTINGIDYSTTGDYVIDTVSAAIGCDSVQILRLIVNDFNEDTLGVSICQGEVFTHNGIDYDTPGYFILDTLPGPGGCDTVRTLHLIVNPLPIANAGNDQELECNVLSVTLNGSATGGAPLWSGPGINAGNETDLMPEVSLPGTYVLTVTSPEGCVDTDTVMVTIDPSTVIADAGPDAFISCDIDTVTLQAGPVGPEFTYQWTGPGINATNENLPNPVITVPGTYTLVVTNTLTGCVSAPDQVFIDNLVTQIVAIIQDPNSLDCYSTFIDLNAAGSSQGINIVYIWFDTEGNIVGNTPVIEISQGGMFTFVVRDTLSGCFASDTIMVEDLTAYPPVDAGPPAQIDCNNPTTLLNEGATSNLPNIIFQWNGPVGGILSPDTLLSVLVGVPGQYYYITAMDTVTGCANTDSVFVADMTTPPLANINVLETITCFDSTALLNAIGSSPGPGVQYTWSGPGINNVVADLIEPISAGTYILTVLNQATGCEAMDTVQLTVPDIPGDIRAVITIPVCAGDPSGSITVTEVIGGTPPFMYSLDGGTPQNSPVFEDLTAGDYIVSVIDQNGCSYEETFTITDGIILTIDIGLDIELELGDSITLWADVSLPWSQIDSIVWSPADILSCTHCLNPVLYGLHNAVVTATVYTSGCLDQDVISVRVDVDADIYIPNVFSPNDDGINDHVTVFTDHRVRRVVYLEIFDRWGNQVFVGEDFLPNDPLIGWDGSFRGKKMNPAVFAYIAKVELINGQQVSRKGDITLIR